MGNCEVNGFHCTGFWGSGHASTGGNLAGRAANAALMNCVQMIAG